MKIKPSQIINLALLLKNLFWGIVVTVICFQLLKIIPKELILIHVVYYLPFIVWLIIVKNIGWGFLKIYCTSYEISETQLIITSGVFNRKTEIIEIFRIKDISIDEPFIYRLFQKGNIIVLSSDASTPKLLLQCLQGFKQISVDLSASVDLQRKQKGVREFD